MITNIVIPIAGEARRFIEEGFLAPKPLTMVKDKHMIDVAMSSIKHHESNRYIFLVRQDHIRNYSIDKILQNTYGRNAIIVAVEKVTRGTLSTCLLAKNYINNDDPMIIWTPDAVFEPAFDVTTISDNIDGALVTFKANSPAHSYTLCNSDTGYATKVAEKEVISNQANTGCYYFRRGRDFIYHAEKMVEQELTVNGEFYVAPVYNLMISQGARIITILSEKMHVLGTPYDLSFYVNCVLNKFGVKPIALCADHSGFLLKTTAKTILTSLGFPFIDFGTYSDEQDCDQHDFLAPAIRHIKSGLSDFGVGFCRTGQAFAMGANKYKEIRGALIFDNYMAARSIEHNCANFFSIPSQYVSADILQSIFIALNKSTFSGGRHLTRLKKICEL